MLAKRYKLNIEQFIQKKPTFVKKGAFFSVKVAQNNLSYSRFGVVVGKKVDKRATERNRIKRLFYRIIREQSLHLIVGKDVMVSIFPEIKQFSTEDADKHIRAFFIALF